MDYQGNSDKSKKKAEPERPKEIEKIVTGEVVRKPKTIGRKFREVFFGGDLRSTATFVVGEVLLPSARDLFFDVISKGSEKVIYGDTRSRGNNSMGYRPSVQYNNPVWRGGSSSMRDPRQRPVYMPDQPPRYRRSNLRDTNDIIVKSRVEAERVVEMMMDVINQYESVSLADLLTMLDIKSTPIDNKWGWTYLNNVDIRQVREGYLIDLPPMEEL